MKTVIKTYVGKLGTITITEYNDNGDIEYRVKHDGISHIIGTEWFDNKRDAIACAQFLAGKY